MLHRPAHMAAWRWARAYRQPWAIAETHPNQLPDPSLEQIAAVVRKLHPDVERAHPHVVQDGAQLRIEEEVGPTGWTITQHADGSAKIRYSLLDARATFESELDKDGNLINIQRIICAFVTAVGAVSILLFHPDELMTAVRLYGATGSAAVFGYLSMRAAESIRNLLY